MKHLAGVTCFLLIVLSFFVVRLAFASDSGLEECADVTSGIVSWWPGNGNTNDVIGSNDGELKNGAGFSDGLAGQAFDLNEPGAYVEVGHHSTLAPSHISVSAWIRPTAYNYAAPIVKKAGIGTTQHYGYALEFSGTPPYDRIIFWISDGGAWWPSLPTNPVELYTWTHVVGTFDGYLVKIYINGQYANAFAIYTLLQPSTNPLMIGKDPSNLDRSFSGDIDEVVIYDRALTPQEISDIFNAGSKGICMVQTDADGDSIPDDDDNCPNIPNPLESCASDDDCLGPGNTCDLTLGFCQEQFDIDQDGLGDACDDDDDGDGFADGEDNCPIEPNPDQADDDFDGLGNACDSTFGAEGPVNHIEETASSAVSVITAAALQGANGMINKLIGDGGVTQTVSTTVVSYIDGLIDRDTYLDELNAALNKLSAFENQLYAKINNGKIEEPEASELISASNEIRVTIEILIQNA